MHYINLSLSVVLIRAGQRKERVMTGLSFEPPAMHLLFLRH